MILTDVKGIHDTLDKALLSVSKKVTIHWNN